MRAGGPVWGRAWQGRQDCTAKHITLALCAKMSCLSPSCTGAGPNPRLSVIAARCYPSGSTPELSARQRRSMVAPTPPLPFPVNPLEEVLTTDDYRRSVIVGILESYNSSYDILAEAVQNAIDALEDAHLSQLPGPYVLEVTVNLRENWISVLDTGVGLSGPEMVNAVRPHVSMKLNEDIRGHRGRAHAYRGYKGVGLTFLAYATDDVRFHSKKDGQPVKARMQYGHAWAIGAREEPANLVADEEGSPLEPHIRGTYVRVQFSNDTRPRSLAHLAATGEAWRTILRTRTAAGQVLLGREPLAPILVSLHVTTTSGAAHHFDPPSTFLYPHEIERDPEFRFLDLNAHYARNAEQAEPPRGALRQDGLYLVWDAERILREMTEPERQRLSADADAYSPHLYAFVPYQGSVWTAMNEIIARTGSRKHLYPGLMLAVNRQRLADVFEIEPTRYETFSRNVLVLVHFDGVSPDQGRKTVQDEVLDLAKVAANRAVQYLGRQRTLLRPVGEDPTPQQRETELNHQDWLINVEFHARQHPMHIPPIAYASIPLNEQDVVGLFNQFSAAGLFPGIRIYATSQIQTYDCLVRYRCPTDTPNLGYSEARRSPLGLSPFVLGDRATYETRALTVEFKNNLDALISDIEDPDSRKSYGHIDLCVCWGVVSTGFAGYELREITSDNLDERSVPGATHVLRRDGETHLIQVVMLQKIVQLIESGQIELEALPPATPPAPTQGK